MNQPSIRQGVDGCQWLAPRDRADREDIPARTRREPSPRPKGCDAWVPRRCESAEQPRVHPAIHSRSLPVVSIGDRAGCAEPQRYAVSRVRPLPEPLRRLAGYRPTVSGELGLCNDLLQSLAWRHARIIDLCECGDSRFHGCLRPPDESAELHEQLQTKLSR